MVLLAFAKVKGYKVEMPNGDKSIIVRVMEAGSEGEMNHILDLVLMAEIIDPETGMKVRFAPGKPGANGFEGKDYYHVHNPNSTGKKDYYLDINGNPVPKGSKSIGCIISY